MGAPRSSARPRSPSADRAIRRGRTPRRRRPRPTGGRRRALLRPALDAAAEVRRKPESQSSLSWNESTSGSSAGRRPRCGSRSSSASRNRVSARNARSFRSSSVNRRSIASSPTSPPGGGSRPNAPGRASGRARRRSRSRALPAAMDGELDVGEGSSRPPKRLFVRRTPFATTPSGRSTACRRGAPGRPRRKRTTGARRPR